MVSSPGRRTGEDYIPDPSPVLEICLLRFDASGVDSLIGTPDFFFDLVLGNAVSGVRRPQAQDTRSSISRLGAVDDAGNSSLLGPIRVDNLPKAHLGNASRSIWRERDLER